MRRRSDPLSRKVLPMNAPIAILDSRSGATRIAAAVVSVIAEIDCDSTTSSC
jgi:hypothetical protein